jgi:hypothetical protein
MRKKIEKKETLANFCRDLDQKIAGKPQDYVDLVKRNHPFYLTFQMFYNNEILNDESLYGVHVRCTDGEKGNKYSAYLTPADGPKDCRERAVGFAHWVSKLKCAMYQGSIQVIPDEKTGGINVWFDYYEIDKSVPDEVSQYCVFMSKV